VEGKPEQALFDAIGQDTIRDIEESRIQQLAVGIEDPDHTDPLHDEEAVIAHWCGDDGRLAEVLGDRLQPDPL
jgi:hypothetical protein